MRLYMNARQKAKYYKRKYEELSNVKINSVIIKTDHQLKQYCISRVLRFYPDDMKPDYIYDRMASLISHDLVPFIKEHINMTNNYGDYKGTFNFWID